MQTFVLAILPRQPHLAPGCYLVSSADTILNVILNSNIINTVWKLFILKVLEIHKLCAKQTKL